MTLLSVRTLSTALWLDYSPEGPRSWVLARCPSGQLCCQQPNGRLSVQREINCGERKQKNSLSALRVSWAVLYDEMNTRSAQQMYLSISQNCCLVRRGLDQRGRQNLRGSNGLQLRILCTVPNRARKAKETRRLPFLIWVPKKYIWSKSHRKHCFISKSHAIQSTNLSLCGRLLWYG
jgi:hypothetical protein